MLDIDAGTIEGLAAPAGLPSWPAHAVALSDGSILLAGGCCDGVDTLPPAAIFDPVTRTARGIDPMTTGRLNQRMTLLPDGRVLITGGLADAGHGYGDALASAEIYDPTTGAFVGPLAMTTAYTSHSATVLSDGSFLIVGADGEPSERLRP